MITDDKRLPTSTEGRDPIIHAVASLAAAISLLERTEHAKNAAASDKMFSQMLQDYRTALDNARTALASAPADPEAAEVDFLVRVLENLDTWRSEEWSELLERRPAILAMLRPMVLASAPVADERQAFETRFNVPPDNWTRSGGGGYRDIWHETRWEGWRARAALASAPVADERKETAGVTLDGCLETLFRVGEHLGIDYAESRKQPGAPSGIYIKAIEDRISQAMNAAREEAAKLMDQTSRSSGATLIRSLASAPVAGEAQQPIGFVDPVYVAGRQRGMPWNAKIYDAPNQEATAPLYAAPQASEAGYALVPIEPTKEMLTAAFELFELAVPGYATGNDARRAIYKAMVGAAK